jgi:hypothetical protein
MALMFYQSSFNQDIGTKVVTINGITYTAWDTLNVTDMNFMFGILTTLSISNSGIHLKLLI